MGIEGVIPPLQEGGVHDTVTAAFPTAGEVIAAVPPKTELVFPVTAIASGLLVFHVRGTPVTFSPALSVTTALRVIVAPLPITNEVWLVGKPCAKILIVCTGQVVKGRGWLLTPPALAKMKVEPGMLACAIS